MKPFTYRAPTTLEGAIALIETQGDNARPLAGGTDLLVRMRYGLLAPEVVVDLKRIPELKELTFDPNTRPLQSGSTIPHSWTLLPSLAVLRSASVRRSAETSATQHQAVTRSPP
jgi:xanthine dehydrogenase iron-sulfur cluster and FAD-binding subunit A